MQPQKTAVELAPELKVALERLKSFREDRANEMRAHLDEGKTLEDPNAIATRLLAAEVFGESVATEVKALQTASDNLIKSQKTAIGKIVSGKDTTFADIDTALTKFSKWPAGSVDAELEKLRAKHDEMTANAKSKLLELVSLDSPAAIDAALDEYATFGAAVATQIDAAKERRTKLIQQANKAMAEITSSSSASLNEVIVMDAKYSDFPSEVRAMRDKLRTMSRKLLNLAKERCAALMKSTDIKAIDEFIAEHEPSVGDTSKGAPAAAPAKVCARNAA